MKNYFKWAVSLALLQTATALWAATTTPVQLLNPTGSTSGQAIVSNGASSAPTWQSVVDSIVAGSGVTISGATGNVTVSVATNGVALGQLAQQPANTVLANATGSTANVAAFAMPSCSTSSSALTWASGSGFTCNTAINASTLGGATFASPGAIGSTTANTGKFTTLQATGAITPSTTAGIVGTATNDNANAGSIGEYPTPGTGSSVSVTTNTTTNIASISLSAGDWDVSGLVLFKPAGGATTGSLQAGVSTTSATYDVTVGRYATVQYSSAIVSGNATMVVPVTRYSLASTTTVFLVASTLFSSGTMSADGIIRARRIR